MARRLSKLRRRAARMPNPELRRRKAEALAARPLARGVAQGEVWDSVRDKAAHERRFTHTGKRGRFRPLPAADPRARGRLPGPARPVRRSAQSPTRSASTMSRDPDAFALLWPKLRAGYLLDALERLDRKPSAEERILHFVTTSPAPPSREDRPSASARTYGSAACA